MENTNTKPLIFVEPLSETLTKLKEVISENAEAEGIELFEVESLDEVSQLLPTIGQSLVLISHPKKCALMLQQNRKAIKILGSKVIMLSPKVIPRKTMDKFMKVGLTECVIEPVNPKTLLYKVKLQIKSIITKEEAGEMNRKFEAEQQAKKEEETMRAEKTVQMEEEKKDAPVRQEKMLLTDDEPVEAEKKERKKYQEETIDGFYKGKSKTNEEFGDEDEDESNSKKNLYQEEAISTHYKGKKSDGTLDQIEEDDLKGKNSTDEIEDVDIHKLRKNVHLKVEEDLGHERDFNGEIEEESENKKSSMKLDIEEDKKHGQKEKQDIEDLGGHYKGKVSKGLNIEDDEQDFYDEKELQEELEKEKKKSASLDVDDDFEKDYHEKHEQEENHNEEKKKAKLNILDDGEDIYQRAQQEDESKADKEKSIKLDVKDDNGPKEKQFDEDIYAEKEDKKQKNKADEIDKYMRSPGAKKALNVEQDDDFYERDKVQKVEDDRNSKMATLDLYDDSKKKKDDQAQSELDEDDLRKKQATLNIEHEDDLYQREKINKDIYDKNREKAASLNIEDDGFGRRNSEFQEKENKIGNRANARADHIKTHYSSKESIKHNNDDWGNGWEKAGQKQDDFPKNQIENEMIIPPSDSLGEQTIDYGKLKKEFESMEYSPRKKKNYDPQFNEKVKETSPFAPRTFTNEEGVVVEESSEELEEDIIASKKVYEPKPVGMDIAIEVLSFYFHGKKEIEDVTTLVAKKIHEKFGGFTSFFSFNKSTGKYTEFYTGQVELLLGQAPKKPTEESLEQMTKATQKETLKKYDQDIKQYHEAKEILVKDWDHYKEDKLALWQNSKLPFWEDQTFQSKSNVFVFPFFEGVDSLGYATVQFENVFYEHNSPTLEMILESSRGSFLQMYHDSFGDKAKYGEEKKKEAVESKAKNFFGKLFGKKAS